MDLNCAQTLLIIRLSSLGDVLLSTPLIRSIKKKYPHIKIDFLVKGKYKDAVQFNPYLSNVLIYNEDKETGKIFEPTIVHPWKYDLIVDLQNNIRSFVICSKLKGRVKKFRKKTFAKLLLVNFKINLLKNAPEIPVRYAQTLNGLALDDEGLDLFLPDGVISVFQDDKNYVGFAPGSRHFTKMWPKKYYVDLGNYLAKSGHTVVLFGGKDDLNICAEISNEIYGSINLCNENNLLSTAADMRKCSAIFCNDSGMMHVASAMHIPVIAFFGSTVSYFGFTPYKNKNIVLENDSLSCRPCSHIGKDACPKKHFKCMNEITPLAAFNKFKSLKEFQ